MVFRAYGFISLIIAGLFFVVNRFLKVDAIKYQASDLLEEAAIGNRAHGSARLITLINERKFRSSWSSYESQLFTQ